jgi:hypothetical protein
LSAVLFIFFQFTFNLDPSHKVNLSLKRVVHVLMLQRRSKSYFEVVHAAGLLRCCLQ